MAAPATVILLPETAYAQKFSSATPQQKLAVCELQRLLAVFPPRPSRPRSSIYRPLKTDVYEIRILVLKPAASDCELDCGLVYWSMEEAKRRGFESVSYCWGDVYDSIFVEGVKLRVPYSAKLALGTFRIPERERHIWIDCICLDQENEDEKSYQIAKMHHVYLNGIRNLVWAGEDDGSAKEAFETMEPLRRELEKKAEQYGSLYSFTAHIRNDAVVDSTTFSFDIEAIGYIIDRPLFRRLWIVQELSLSKDSVLFCGDCTISMVTFYRAMAWLWYHRRTWPSAKRRRQVHKAYKISYYADKECSWYDGRLNMKDGHNNVWQSLLNQQRRYQVQDPRDRIYALLGMAQHYNGSKSLPKFLQPDHTKSLMEIYRDATRHAIESSRSVHLLTCARPHCDQDGGNRENWPSWLPCWHHPRAPKVDEYTLGSFFNAAQSRSQVIVRTITDLCVNAILLKGIYVDGREGSQVVGKSNVLEHFTYNEVSVFLKRVFAMHGRMSDCNHNETSDTLVETITAGQNSHYNPITGHDIGGMHPMLEHMRELEQLPPALKLLSEYSGEAIRQAAHLCHAIEKACHRRRFFTTKAGRIGLGPQNMEIDDIVIILWGGRHPFVLRPLGELGMYSFVGVCYVHGIMYGEAVKEHEASGASEEKFVLL